MVSDGCKHGKFFSGCQGALPVPIIHIRVWVRVGKKIHNMGKKWKN
jgi:hypothetical protein